MRFYSIIARNGTNKPSLQEGSPLIYQTPVTSQIILLDRSHVDMAFIYLATTEIFTIYTIIQLCSIYFLAYNNISQNL